MLTEPERRFINHCQGGFPLTPRPFATLAEILGNDEQPLMALVTSLLDRGLLSRFGPLYDALRLGGGLTLAALAVPEQRYREVTRMVNQHREVAHNYRREHPLNMWFVLASETPSAIPHVIAAIERETGLAVQDFPKQREFYIGLWLHLTDRGVATVPPPATPDGKRPFYTLDAADRRLIDASQSGLPVSPRPYRLLAERSGLDEDQVLQRLQAMLAAGIIRRIGAVPNHYRLGLKANGMTVWDIPDSLLETCGERLGRLDFVSHCYQRPRRRPLWPYNLFAMVHGERRSDVDAKVAQMRALLGNAPIRQQTLFSTAILKKSGLRLAA